MAPIALGGRSDGSPLAILYIVVGSLLVAAVLVLMTTTLVDPTGPRWNGRDHQSYVQIAVDGPFAAHTYRGAPFCWRVLIPSIAYYTGTDGPLVFHLVSSLAAAVALMLVAMLFLRWGYDPLLVVVVAALIACTGPWRDSLHNYYVGDIPMIAFSIALVWLAELRKWTAFAALNAIACLNREAALGFLLMPFLVFWLLERQSFVAAALKTSAIAFVPLAAVVGIRLAIVPSGQHSIWKAISTSIFPSFDYFAGVTVRSWGVLLVLAMAVPVRRIAAICMTRPHLACVVVIAFLQTLLGGDTQRLFGVAAGFVMLLAIEGLQELRIRHWAFFVGLIAVQYLLFATDFREPWLAGIVPNFRTVKFAAYGLVIAAAAAMLVWANFYRHPSHQVGANVQR
jgi:hypothetical protein